MLPAAHPFLLPAFPYPPFMRSYTVPPPSVEARIVKYLGVRTACTSLASHVLAPSPLSNCLLAWPLSITSRSPAPRSFRLCPCPLPTTHPSIHQARPTPRAEHTNNVRLNASRSCRRHRVETAAPSFRPGAFRAFGVAVAAQWAILPRRKRPEGCLTSCSSRDLPACRLTWQSFCHPQAIACPRPPARDTAIVIWPARAVPCRINTCHLQPTMTILSTASLRSPVSLPRRLAPLGDSPSPWTPPGPSCTSLMPRPRRPSPTSPTPI